MGAMYPSRAIEGKAPQVRRMEAVQEYRSMLRPTQGEIKKVEVGLKKDMNQYYDLAAKEGLIIKEMKEPGSRRSTLDTREAREQLSLKSEDLSEKLDKKLARYKGPQFDLNQIRKSAKINVSIRTKNALDRAKSHEDIDNYINSEIQRNNGMKYVNIQQLNRIKQGMWLQGYDMLRPTARKNARILGHIMKVKIERALPNSFIKELNEKSGQYATLTDLLENAQGRVVAGGVMGRYFAKTIGALAGSKIPIVGPVLGAHLGGRISENIYSPERISRSASEKYNKTLQPNVPLDVQIGQKAIEANRLLGNRGQAGPFNNPSADKGETVSPSKIVKILSQNQQEVWTPQQLKGFLSGKVSQAEMDTLLTPELMSKPKITKTEVLQSIEQNMPKVETVVKGKSPLNITPNENEPHILEVYRADDPTGEYSGMVGEIIHKTNFKGDKGLYEVNVPELQKIRFNTLEDAKDYISSKTDFGTKTKFSQYQLSGGENYQETLIKAPEKKDNAGIEFSRRFQELKKKYNVNEGEQFLKAISKEESNELTRLSKAADISVDDIKKGTFKSSHWDEPNVLAHVRHNDRVTPEGRKVRFLEEIQSDWAKKGREEETKHTDWIEGGKKQPSHPLLKNWQELSLKQSLKDAAKSDAEYLSWTTGEQQASRYDLSKQVDSVTIAKTPEGYAKGKIRVSAYKDGDVAIEKFVDDYKSVGELVGKDLAGKAERELIGGKDQVMYEGQDLRVGGEWAKNLYDKQIPNILKKLTGRDVEMINLDISDKAHKATSAVINPDNFVTNKYRVGKLSGGGYGVFDIKDSNLIKHFATEREAINFVNIPEHNLQPAIRLTPELKKEIMSGKGKIGELFSLAGMALAGSLALGGTAQSDEIVDMDKIFQIESSGNPKAHNIREDARGLGQIRKGVLVEWNLRHKNDKHTKSDLFNPEINRKISTWYMEKRIPEMLKVYKKPDTLENRIISYNAGIKFVKNNLAIPSTTRKYIQKYKSLNRG
jgi:hypothetical protein